MRRSSASNTLLAIAILILLSNSSMAVLVDQSDLSQGISVNGGRTILVEEITATWCISCTEIDPYLEEVADSHGSRISLVALHPQDGVDVFANEASQKRIERIEANHGSYPGTPSFSVNGLDYHEGPNSWPSVQREILDEETKRSNHADIQISAIHEDGIIRLEAITDDFKSNQQFTLMFLEHQKQLPNGDFPGDRTRERVLTDMISFGQNGTTTYGDRNSSNFSIFQNSSVTIFYNLSVTQDEVWSIIGVLEYNDDHVFSGGLSSSLGAVEISNRELTNPASSNYSTLILLGFLSLGLVYIFIKK